MASTFGRGKRNLHPEIWDDKIEGRFFRDKI